ncbi:MAG: VOC family protein [Candidatus Eisenbacteria bacterium]
MKLRLHEIELNSARPEASKAFYGTLLGLPINVDQDGLKCFGSGWPGLDVAVSVHFPGRASVSFLVDDIDAYAAMLREKGLEVEEPKDSHLGMRAISLEDPDGHRIEIRVQQTSRRLAQGNG